MSLHKVDDEHYEDDEDFYCCCTSNLKLEVLVKTEMVASGWHMTMEAFVPYRSPR